MEGLIFGILRYVKLIVVVPNFCILNPLCFLVCSALRISSFTITSFVTDIVQRWDLESWKSR